MTLSQRSGYWWIYEWCNDARAARWEQIEQTAFPVPSRSLAHYRNSCHFICRLSSEAISNFSYYNSIWNRRIAALLQWRTETDTLREIEGQMSVCSCCASLKRKVAVGLVLLGQSNGGHDCCRNYKKGRTLESSRKANEGFELPCGWRKKMLCFLDCWDTSSKFETYLD